MTLKGVDMASTISRRDFLKHSSVAGAAAMMVPAAGSFAEKASASKSRVVIITDPGCSNGGTPVQTNIREMVNQGVKTLTGMTDTGAAYEALFPGTVGSSTKILMKRNDISGAQRDFSAVNTVVTGAFKTGCGTMMGGSYNESNVTIRCQGGSARSQIESSDYLINCPVCSCHGTDYGVTLSLKNTMTYLNSANTYHSANKRWLHEVSLDPLIKGKQVMSIMDAVVGNNRSGPGGTPNIEPKTIIMSKDIVAVDYHALRVMEQNGNPDTNRIRTADAQLEAAQSAGLGTCTPANMEVIDLSPPYTTGGIREYNPQIKTLQVNVLDRGGYFEFILPVGTASTVTINIADMLGRTVWRSECANVNAIVWHRQTAGGNRVPDGMYTYSMTLGARRKSGVLMVTR